MELVLINIFILPGIAMLFQHVIDIKTVLMNRYLLLSAFSKACAYFTAHSIQTRDTSGVDRRACGP